MFQNEWIYKMLLLKFVALNMKFGTSRLSGG
jgi:hypothetical protein